MADEHLLAGLNAYDAQDVECARLRSWFGALDDADLSIPSACEGWSRRDVLSHLLATETYFTACLDGTVAELIQRFAANGDTTLNAINASGVAASRDLDGAILLDRWATQNAANRAGFRSADGTDIDSSIGTYPATLQAFHVAFEYAIHANDVDAPVRPGEYEDRQQWMAAVAQFALTEAHPGTVVEVADDRYTVRGDSIEATVERDLFVAGVAGRAVEGSLTAEEAELLAIT